MPNGKPGDHPLTDILVHRIRVYGREADNLIRKISALSSMTELDNWWNKEIGWTPEPKTVLPKAKARYAELQRRAKESGWETER